MSVLDELSKHAQDTTQPKFEGGSFNEGSAGMAEQQAMMESVSLPGQSLTQDPKSPAPYETAPEFTNLQEFTEETFRKLSDPDQLPRLLEVLRKGVPAEYMAEKLLKSAVSKGKINPDMLVSAVEPTTYLIMALGTYGGVDVVVYPEDDMIDSAEDSTAMFRKSSASLLADQDEEAEPTGNPMVTMNTPPNAPRNLLERGNAAVQNMNKGNPNES